MILRSMAVMVVVLAFGISMRHVHAQVNIYYDFEGDSGDIVVDKLADDGAQNGQLLGNVAFDSFVVPWGTQSLFFDIPDPLPGVPPYSTLEIPDTTFDADFSLTLAAFVDNKEDVESPRRVSRLF